MDDSPTREFLRVQARLKAFEDLKAEIEPWLMEEREASAREALANVLFHLDAEIAEQRRRLDQPGACRT
jgi:hypothetical protein